jgi:S1-C subfamily serine protease
MGACLLLYACVPPYIRFPVTAHARVITAVFKGLTVGAGVGTGFIVGRLENGNALIVTSAHVLDGAHVVGIGVDDDIVDAKVVAIDLVSDLALLESKVRGTPVPLGRYMPSVGAQIYGMGMYAMPVMLSGVLSTGPIPCSSTGPVECYMTTIPVGPGYSGSAVLNGDGEVIGVIRAYHTQRPFLGMFVGVRALREFLLKAAGI